MKKTPLIQTISYHFHTLSVLYFSCKFCNILWFGKFYGFYELFFIPGEDFSPGNDRTYTKKTSISTSAGSHFLSFALTKVSKKGK